MAVLEFAIQVVVHVLDCNTHSHCARQVVLNLAL